MWGFFLFRCCSPHVLVFFFSSHRGVFLFVIVIVLVLAASRSPLLLFPLALAAAGCASCQILDMKTHCRFTAPFSSPPIWGSRKGRAAASPRASTYSHVQFFLLPPQMMMINDDEGFHEKKSAPPLGSFVRSVRFPLATKNKNSRWRAKGEAGKEKKEPTIKSFPPFPVFPLSCVPFGIIKLPPSRGPPHVRITPFPRRIAPSLAVWIHIVYYGRKRPARPLPHPLQKEEPRFF